MAEYVAWLRGINLGGRTVKMDRLRYLLESKGFQQVRTVLASGNVVLESKSRRPAAVRAKMEKAIQAAFGFEVPVIVRSDEEILALVKESPFKRVKVTPQTRLYVTFLSKPVRTKLKLPYTHAGSGFRILKVTPGHVIGVGTLSTTSGTTDAMRVLAQEFGSEITTRNWNTIQKVAKLLD